MKNESSVPAAHKMMDVTLPIFQVEVQNTADSDDRSQGSRLIRHLTGEEFCLFRLVSIFEESLSSKERICTLQQD
jgi:hypothetical protein